MMGICPTCKKQTELTKRHDKEIGKTVTLCRQCHDIVEAYVRFLAMARETGGPEGGP